MTFQLVKKGAKWGLRKRYWRYLWLYWVPYVGFRTPWFQSFSYERDARQRLETLTEAAKQKSAPVETVETVIV
jgi:hypothetical protein